MRKIIRVSYEFQNCQQRQKLELSESDLTQAESMRHLRQFKQGSRTMHEEPSRGKLSIIVKCDKYVFRFRFGG